MDTVIRALAPEVPGVVLEHLDDYMASDDGRPTWHMWRVAIPGIPEITTVHIDTQVDGWEIDILTTSGQLADGIAELLRGTWNLDDDAVIIRPYQDNTYLRFYVTSRQFRS